MYRTPINTLYSSVDAVGVVLQRLQESNSASQVNMMGLFSSVHKQSTGLDTRQQNSRVFSIFPKLVTALNILV